MLPVPRNSRQHERQSARESAVLVTLFERDDQLLLLLTRRTENTHHHKGQISLPGGARDPQDADLWQTALREAQEEVGLAPEAVRCLGALTPLWVSASGFVIHPFLGWVPVPPSIWRPSPDEVAEVIELPLAVLADADAHAEDAWSLADREARVPYYRYQEHRVWGATAMILSELEVMLAALPGCKAC